MIRILSLSATLPLVLGSLAATANAAEYFDANSPKGDFARLHSLIKPQPGESPWREMNWLTNVTEARQRAVAENKPIVIFTAADGSPLGRT